MKDLYNKAFGEAKKSPPKGNLRKNVIINDRSSDRNFAQQAAENLATQWYPEWAIARLQGVASAKSLDRMEYFEQSRRTAVRWFGAYRSTIAKVFPNGEQWGKVQASVDDGISSVIQADDTEFMNDYLNPMLENAAYQCGISLTLRVNYIEGFYNRFIKLIEYGITDGKYAGKDKDMALEAVRVAKGLHQEFNSKRSGM